MNAGLFKEVIEIYQPVIYTNMFGEETTEFKLKYTTKARIVNNGGNREVGDEIFYTQIKDFQVRIYVPIKDFDRVKWQNNYYRVLNIDKNKDLQAITIKTEKVND